MMKKIFLVVFAVAMVAFLGSTLFFGLLNGSASMPSVNVDAEQEEVEEGPLTTSEEASLYVNGIAVCNRDGVEQTDYRVDETGNIVTESGEIIVKANRVQMFTAADKAELISEKTHEMAGERISDEIVLVTPVSVPIDLIVSPVDVVNRTVTIESVDANAFVFTSSDMDGVQVLLTNDEGGAYKVSANLTEEGKITVLATCNTEGDHVIRVRNILGEVIGEFTFSFTAVVPDVAPEDDEEADTTETHVHEYEETVIAPTATTRGYTKHTCKTCGASYTDNYTDVLPHEHDYDSKVIAATYTSKGYTLYTCKICGHTYKGDYTDVLVCHHDHMKDTVVKPTCTVGGYTLHECLVCKNYSYKDNETQPTGHKWDDGKITTKPTCSKEGVKSFTCSVCGEKRTEKVAKIDHEYETKVVEPTYTDKGYTLHTCKMCGHSYKDNYTDVKPHEHSYKTRTVAPTCTEKGYVEHKCSTCGEVYKTDEKPALGHNYKDTVVEPTQTEKGYTHHECTRCGDSYDDNYVDPLPAVSAGAASAAGNAWMSSNGYTVSSGCIGGSCYIMTTVDVFDYGFNQSGLNQEVVKRAMATAPVINQRAIDDGYECAVFYCYCEDRGDGTFFIAIYYGYYNYLGEPIDL